MPPPPRTGDRERAAQPHAEQQEPCPRTGDRETSHA